MYQDISTKEREHIIAKGKGTIFVTQIGKKIKNNIIHDGRNPEYDDMNLMEILFYGMNH